VIPPGFIHDLLSRVDIVDVVGRHVELKKAGINHKGLCPFHGEKSPSFIVSPSRQTYHCFGCGVHGNAIGFLMEHAGAGFVEAVEDLAQQVGMQVPEDDRSVEQREAARALRQRQATLSDVLERAAAHYKQQLKKNPRAIDYLKGRGLSGEVARDFGLGFAPEGWRTLASAFPAYDDPLLEESGLVITQGEDSIDKKRSGPSAGPPQAGPHPPGGSADVPDRRGAKRYDRFRDRIMFPIRNVQGEVIGFGGRVLDKGEPKYLNSPETPVFNKGRELYGLFEARSALRQRGYCLVVEGYMDVVALAQHGFGNAVATLGTACTADHVHKLFRFTESVVFSFDGDAAGRRAAGRALEAALPHASDTRTIRFLFLPAEHDPDSYVREFGAAAFEQCVEAAVPLSRQLLDSAAEGCDLTTAEGRARMLANARPLWSQLPDGLLRHAVLGDLARRSQLSEPDLQRLWGVGAGAPHSVPAAAQGDGGARAPRSGSEGRHWKDGGSGANGGGRRPWRGRGEPPDPSLSVPRRAPIAPIDLALRMLLLECGWWEQLGPEDQQLLHELPGVHGELVRWVERYLMNHGPAPWSVLEAALADDGLLDAARGLPGGLRADEPASFADLQALLRRLLIEQLKRESQLLAAANDREGLLRLNERIRVLGGA